MRFKALELEGFRSFRKSTEFEFPDRPDGFYQISGRNLVEPELGANGCGKSTLWDGLCWVLFGESARGLRAGNVCSWGAKEVRGSVTFEQDGEDHEIQRGWSPNYLLWDGADVEQETINDRIGFDATMFLNCCLMGQFADFFFDMTDTGKLNLFSQILDLDVWMSASKRAAKKLKVLGTELVHLEQEEAKQTEGINILKDRRKVLNRHMRTWLTDQAVRVQGLQGVRSCLKDKHGELLEDRQDAKTLRDTLTGSEETLAKLLSELAEKINEAKSKKNILYAEKLVPAETQLRAYKAQEKDLQELVGECPTCRQEVKPKAREAAVMAIRARHTFVQGVVNKYKAKCNKMLKGVFRLEKQFEDTEEDLTTERTQAKGAQEDLNRVRAKVHKLEADLRSNRLLLDEVEEREDPHEADLLEVKEGQDTRTRALKTCRKSIKQNRRQDANLQYWPKGFKDVRLWLIDYALQELEVEVNNSLLALGLRGWRIEMSVERELKSGGITRGFTVTIHTPEGHSAPWKGWSGGETQRLRIAGAVGLANLIAGRRQFKPTIEVWDEPTAYLSREGVRDLLEFLEDRARAGRQVYVVDHRSLSAPFDETFHIIRGKAGSRIRIGG